MEETTDEKADRRRLGRVCAKLSAQPGAFPVELLVKTSAGTVERLQLGGVADADGLIPELKALLGVLGDAREVGDPAYAGDALAAADAG